MDLEDYLANNLIGPGNQQANCSGLELMVVNARATRDAMLKAVNELFLASTARVRTEASGKWSTIVNRLNEWNQKRTNLYFFHEILFNSIVCPGPFKKTVDEVMLVYPYITGYEADEPFAGFNTRSIATVQEGQNGPTIPYASAQTYDVAYLNNYKNAHEEFLCDTKKVIAFLLDQRPGEGDIPPGVPVNGYCPPWVPAS